MPSEDTWSVPTRESIPSLTHDQLSEHLRLARINAGHYMDVNEALVTELKSRSPTSSYKCMKCDHEKYELHQIRAPRSLLSSFFGVESAQYRAVVCTRCKFTEFYQGTVPIGEQALDFLLGG